MRAPATKQKNVLPEGKPFFVWADGGVFVAGGVGVYEAGCYLTDKDAKKEPRGSDAKKAPSDSGAVAKK